MVGTEGEYGSVSARPPSVVSQLVENIEAKNIEGGI